MVISSNELEAVETHNLLTHGESSTLPCDWKNYNLTDRLVDI